MNKPDLQQYIHDKVKNNDDIWITSDIHGFHKNICHGSSSWNDRTTCRKYDNESIMTNQLTINFNQVVKKNDVVIHCGDLCFGQESNVNKLMDSFICKNWIHVFGNHENHTRAYNNFIYTCDYLELTINKQFYVFFHYPIGSWNLMSSGSMHCFGHCHGNYDNHGKSMDVGVDTNNLFPYNIKDIYNELSHREIVAKDHHN